MAAVAGLPEETPKASGARRLTGRISPDEHDGYRLTVCRNDDAVRLLTGGASPVRGQPPPAMGCIAANRSGHPRLACGNEGYRGDCGVVITCGYTTAVGGQHEDIALQARDATGQTGTWWY
jgi:hypothetical protein